MRAIVLLSGCGDGRSPARGRPGGRSRQRRRDNARMPLVAGIDCSTTATKVVVRDAETGELLRDGRAAHPPGTEIAPERWDDALRAASDGLLEGVDALSVAAQQHGMVVL